MDEFPDELDRRLARLAADRESGAAALADAAVAILAAAIDAGRALTPIARALCAAQPAMAPVWNAALEAIASAGNPLRFTRYRQRIARSPAALARVAADYFADSVEGAPRRFVTISSSRSVLLVLEAVRQRRSITVACSESRPALEGRDLAARLAAAGVPVTCYSDAALAHALADADAVLAGADAIGPDWFLNKSGTRMLAAAAAQQGVPVYVAATRDKFVGPAVAERLVIREGAPEEIWEGAPAGIAVRNPYFESTPLEVVTTILSDVGVLGIGMVPEVCRSVHDAAILQALALIDATDE